MFPGRVKQDSCPACSAPIARHPAVRRWPGLVARPHLQGLCAVLNASEIVSQAQFVVNFFSLLTSTQGFYSFDGWVYFGQFAIRPEIIENNEYVKACESRSMHVWPNGHRLAVANSGLQRAARIESWLSWAVGTVLMC